jgi:hypothetical protein
MELWDKLLQTISKSPLSLFGRGAGGEGIVGQIVK